MRKNAWMLAGLFTLAADPVLAVDEIGLSSNLESLSWSRWQGRVSFGETGPLRRSSSGGFDSNGLQAGRSNGVDSLSLMGDFYFLRSLVWPGSVGGFRATSGVIIGPRASLPAGQSDTITDRSFRIGNRMLGQVATYYTVNAPIETAALPYLGLGYTGLSLRGGWSVNADMGMIQRAGTGRLFGGGEKRLGESLGDQRLAPLFQLGISRPF